MLWRATSFRRDAGDGVDQRLRRALPCNAAARRSQMVHSPWASSPATWSRPAELTVRRKARDDRPRRNGDLRLRRPAGGMERLQRHARYGQRHRPARRLPAAGYYVAATLIALAAALDLQMILQRGIAGAPQGSRAICGGCLAWFVATAPSSSASNGWAGRGAGSPILLVLGFAPLGFMLFWPVRAARQAPARRA